jgi:starvation-inducible outer membrane lipoprotein
MLGNGLDEQRACFIRRELDLRECSGECQRQSGQRVRMMMTEHACWRKEEREKKSARMGGMLVKVREQQQRVKDSRPAGKDC